MLRILSDSPIFFKKVYAMSTKIGNLILPGYFGYAGISMATSVALVTMALFMMILIIKKINKTENRKFIVSVSKFVLLYIICLVILLFINDYFAGYFDSYSRIDVLIKLFVSGVVLLFIYLTMCYLFKLKTVLVNLIKEESEA